MKFCKSCWELEKNTFNDGNTPKNYGNDFPGYYRLLILPKDNRCFFCKNELEESILNEEELKIIQNISNDATFLEAMIKLKKSDQIEYQFKMSQFRANLEQQKVAENTAKQQAELESSKVACPRCGSTKTQSGYRGYTILTGFIGSSSQRITCQKCGYKWKPGSWTEAINRDLHGHQ